MTYLFNLRIWAGISERRISSWFGLFSRLNAIHIISFILLILTILLVYTKIILKAPGRASGFSVIYLIFCTGWCGMAAELSFLYLFQNIYGCLYQKIGLFIASFMIGLAAGGWSGVIFVKKITSPRKMMYALFIADAIFWLFLLLAAFLIPSLELAETAFYLIVTAAGILTGIQFPLASSLHFQMSKKIGKSAGYMDTADHAGAAVGSFVTAIILIPALGIPVTLFLLAFLKLTSITLIKSNGLKKG